MPTLVTSAIMGEMSGHSALTGIFISILAFSVPFGLKVGIAMWDVRRQKRQRTLRKGRVVGKGRMRRRNQRAKS